MRFRLSLLVFSFLLVIRADAQTQPNIENGFKAYGSYDASKIDTINLSNGGLTIHIPLPFSYPQRGGKLNDSYFLVSNSKHWQVQYYTNSNGLNYYWDYGNGPYAKYTVPLGPYLTGTFPLYLYRTFTTEVDSANNFTDYDGGYYLQSWDGSVHQLFDTSGGARTSFESSDTSGYRLVASNPDSYGTSTTFVVTDRNGNVFQGNKFIATTAPACTKSGGTLPGSTTITTCPQVTGFSTVTDSNGNLRSTTDTLGRSFPLVSTSASDSSGCVSSLPFVSSTLYNYTGPNGATEQIKVCNGSLTMQTNFSQSGVAQFPGGGPTSPNPVSVITTLILPNNTKFTLTYDSYGEVTNIGLPTGGSIAYTWTEISFPSCGNTQVSRAVASRTVYDGTNSFTTNYSWGTQPSATVTDPLGNDTVHTFSAIGAPCNFYETTTQSYQGTKTAGQLLRQIDTTYQGGASVGDNTTAGGGWAVPTSIKTTDLVSGQVTLVQKTYDPGLGTNNPIFGEVTSEKDYDWGSGAQGALLREIDTTYLWQNDTRYLTANLLDLAASVITKDGGGNRVAETDYTYDESSYLTTSNVTTNHGAAPNPSPVRGNPTTVSKWLNTTGSQITSHTNWYDTGEVYQSLDPLNHPTTYLYSGTFDGAYPTTITNALNQSATYNYDFGTGLLISATDANSKTTSYNYDGMFRLFQVNRPDGGVDSLGYQESAYPFSATLTKQIASSINLVKTNTFDGVGRLTQSQLTSDPQGTVYANTSYDALGRVSATSNPYRSTSESTYGLTTTLYDAIGRACVVIPADGSSVSGTCPNTPPSNDVFTSYSGNTTTVTDQASKQRRTVTDGLGRLVEVDEPSFLPATPGSGSSAVNGSEQSVGGAAATSGTGSATVSGNEQSTSGISAAAGTGSVTISGSEQSFVVNDCLPPKTCNRTVYDSGAVSVTVNGFAVSVGYTSTSTTSKIAAALAQGFNGNSSSPVTASANGAVVSLTSKATGSASNYSLSTTSSTNDPADFGGPSFTTSTSGATLTGGRDAVPAISDTGTIWVTVNGTQYSTSYGSGSTPTSLASALAGVITANSTVVTASASGTGISLTAKTTGFNTNYSLSSGSSTSQSATFSHPSFSVSVSGANMTGGNNAGPTVYDSGSIWVTVNGTQYSTTYGSGSTTSSLASALAGVINSNSSFVTASASGAGITLTATTVGSSTNYSLSSGSSTSQPGTFSPSFTVSISGSALTGGANATAPSLSTPSVTLYTYDALSNLTCVVQKNVDTSAFTNCASAPPTWRPRSFVYDSLSRLRSASNPESGTITYTYDNDGNVQTKTDARGIQTTFSYDPLDRLTGKTYSNGDPSISFTYDASPCLGAPSCSNVGRRTGMTDAAGTESWSYDAMGRPIVDRRTTNGVTKTTAYSYNFDGSIATLSYPSGRVVTYQPSAAGHTLWAKDIPNSIVYAGGTCGPTADGACYSPFGALSLLYNNGAGIVSTLYYNTRLQPCRISVKSSGTAPSSCSDNANIGNILDYTYNFSLGAADNGNVTAIANNRDNTRSQSFTYDALNRLASAQTQTSGVTIPNSNCWGLNYGYDAWGNLLYSTFTGPSGCGQPLPLNVSATTSNQIAGYCYDTAGNLLDQATCPTTGSHSYAYNAENQMTSAVSVSYLYDGDGKRVQKSNGKLYWYGTGSDPLDETDAAGNLLEEYIFFSGKRIARRDGNNNVTYYFADHLGTARVTASAAGAILDDSDFYPFGGERPVTSSSGNTYKFTGKERDSESGLDDFDARYYSSSMGRFMSPDWSSSPEPVPYADLGNPQTLNLYSYATNNPTTFDDPNGHCIEDGCVVEGLAIGAALRAVAQWGVRVLVAAAVEKVVEYAKTLPSETASAPSTGCFCGTDGVMPQLIEKEDTSSDQTTNEKTDSEPAPTEAYDRQKHYGKTPTEADRKAVGGESVDHDPPLVKRYYEGDKAKGEKPGYSQTPSERKASANDRSRMKPSTTKEQQKQGGKMSQYSKDKKKEHGFAPYHQ